MWASAMRSRRAHIISWHEPFDPENPEGSDALCGFFPKQGWVRCTAGEYPDITQETTCIPCIGTYRDTEGTTGPLAQANRIAGGSYA